MGNLAQILRRSLSSEVISLPLLWAFDPSFPLLFLFPLPFSFLLSCLDLILPPCCPRLDHTSVVFLILKSSAHHNLFDKYLLSTDHNTHENNVPDSATQ